MAIIGVGIDVVDIERFGHSLARTPGLPSGCSRRPSRPARWPRWPRGSPPRRRSPRPSAPPATCTGTTPRWSPRPPAGRCSSCAAPSAPAPTSSASPRAPLALPRRRHRVGRRGAGVLRRRPRPEQILGAVRLVAPADAEPAPSDHGVLALATRGDPPSRWSAPRPTRSACDPRRPRVAARTLCRRTHLRWSRSCRRRCPRWQSSVHCSTSMWIDAVRPRARASSRRPATHYRIGPP